MFSSKQTKNYWKSNKLDGWYTCNWTQLIRRHKINMLIWVLSLFFQLNACPRCVALFLCGILISSFFNIYSAFYQKKKLREEKRYFHDFKMTACYNNQYFIALLIQVQGSLKTSGSNFQSIVFHHTKKNTTKLCRGTFHKCRKLNLKHAIWLPHNSSNRIALNISIECKPDSSIIRCVG